MTLLLEGVPLHVTDADLVGEGGEARVFRHRKRVVKLFHQPNAKRAAKLKAFPQGLPSEIVGPDALVTDLTGEVRGYAMREVAHSQPFSMLASRRARQNVLSSDAVARHFERLAQVLQLLHRRSVIVGDLNDGNVLLAPAGLAVIDADSLQYGVFRCEVGHERFLDPRLYGVDLTTAQHFTPATDWYAWAVMLFSSLTFVHPFGGTHPSLPTLLRRGEARVSVFQRSVKLPRTALPPTVLPDDVAHWFRAVFESDERTPPPQSVLSLRLTVCSCGLEHGRAVCPTCHALGPLVARPVLRSRGRCVARTVFSTSGRVLAAAIHGGLRYAYEEGGEIRREDGSAVRPSLGVNAVCIAASATWVSPRGGHFECVVGGVVKERVSADSLATSQTQTLASQANWLVDVATGSRCGQVLEGQTRLFAGDCLSCGFYRVGGLTVAFVLRRGRAGLKRVEGVSWRGRIVEAHATFDAQHVLLTVVTDEAKDVVHRWLINTEGHIVAQSHGGTAGHAALLSGRVVIGTDSGLVSLTCDSGHLLESTRFTDTEGFVSAQDVLLSQYDGSLVVVGTQDIVQLSLQ
jgi:hypothetical protein